jgi:hypothetical protein
VTKRATKSYHLHLQLNDQENGAGKLLQPIFHPPSLFTELQEEQYVWFSRENCLPGCFGLCLQHHMFDTLEEAEATGMCSLINLVVHLLFFSNLHPFAFAVNNVYVLDFNHPKAMDLLFWLSRSKMSKCRQPFLV